MWHNTTMETKATIHIYWTSTSNSWVHRTKAIPALSSACQVEVARTWIKACTATARFSNSSCISTYKTTTSFFPIRCLHPSRSLGRSVRALTLVRILICVRVRFYRTKIRIPQPSRGWNRVKVFFSTLVPAMITFWWMLPLRNSKCRIHSHSKSKCGRTWRTIYETATTSRSARCQSPWWWTWALARIILLKLSLNLCTWINSTLWMMAYSKASISGLTTNRSWWEMARGWRRWPMLRSSPEEKPTLKDLALQIYSRETCPIRTKMAWWERINQTRIIPLNNQLLLPRIWTTLTALKASEVSKITWMGCHQAFRTFNQTETLSSAASQARISELVARWATTPSGDSSKETMDSTKTHHTCRCWNKTIQMWISRKE